MRDIFFRGKRLDNGEWVYGNFCRVEMNNHGGDEYFIIEYSCEGSQHYVDPSTVGQYTGLTDKTGKKIFEGDIVKFFCGWDTKKSCQLYCYYLVCYRDGAFRLRNHPGYGYLWENVGNCEAAGNIFDNPELKKKVR